MTIIRKIRPYGILVIATLVVILFQNYVSGWMYQKSYDLYPLYKGIDPDNAFMYLFLHHIMQAVMYLILILIAARLLHIKFRDFGFNLDHAKISIKYTVYFVIFWVVIQYGVGYLMYLGGSKFSVNYIVNNRNVTGYFLFEILLSGTSEELFYRGFLVTVTLTLMQVYVKKQRNLYVIATLVSIVIFMTGHITFTLFPFRIMYINFLQQLTVISGTIFYCICFLRTKSLLGPILMHNLLNGLATWSALLYTYLSSK